MENNNVHVIPTMSSDDRAALSGEQESLLNSAPFPLESIDPPTEQDLQNVENFFGIWKGYVRKNSPSVNTLEELKSVVVNGFNYISVGMCQNTIRNVLNEIFERVQNEEDL